MVHFTYEYVDASNEYVIYKYIDGDGEVFCHLSESDLDIFIALVKSSKSSSISHVLDEDPMGDGQEPRCWP